MWIPTHSGITRNKRADEAAKNALEEVINDRELYPPQDLINWLKKTDAKNRQERWTQWENTMRFRKETIEWKDDSTNLSRKEQVVVSILRTGYTRATHRHVIEKTPSPECAFCGESLTTEHMQWECMETTKQRKETGTTKKICTDETEGLKRLIEYSKRIGLFHGIWTRTTCGRSRTNHKELKKEEYKWTTGADHQ
jgi:hypothetical protein